MKIYTKTGDKGETGIIGKRISKASRLIDSLGSLDEVNAAVGIILSEIELEDKKELKKLKSELGKIQSILFSIGGLLANGKVKINFKNETKLLEKNIDRMDKELEPLQNFILPGGNKAAVHTHLARAICRRAERRMVELFEESNLTQEDEILPYINRLSDYLFTLARYINKKSGNEEVKWSSRN